MLKWLGDEGDRLSSAFRVVFGGKCVAFGKPSTQIGGVSDGAEGVQWNASYDPRNQRQWASVNLEGMEYVGWPVQRLIRRELRKQRLLDVQVPGVGTPAVEVRWMRDYWQVSDRPAIRERDIISTPILIGDLTEVAWRQALEGALACLDESREWRKRARQRVTLVPSGEVVEGEVSPHLTLTVHATSYTPWTEFLSEAQSALQPYHGWASSRSG